MDHFLNEIGEKNGKDVTIAKSGMNLCRSKAWPGNVRELRNFIERIVILSNKDEIDADDILRYSYPEQSNLDSAYDAQALKDAKRQFEKQLIINRLIKHSMNVTKTAESLDIERTYLHKKIKELEIDKEMEILE